MTLPWSKLDHIAFGVMAGFEAILLSIQIFGLLIALATRIKIEDEDVMSHIWGKSKFGFQCLAIAASICGLRWLSIILAIIAFVAGVGSIIEFKIKRGRRLTARKHE